MNTSERRRRAQAILRATALVYGGTGFLSALMLPLGLQPLIVVWLVVGNLVLGRYGIAPPDHEVHTLRYWLEHLKMALSWPLLWYWVRSRHARVRRRDPWRLVR